MDAYSDEEWKDSDTEEEKPGELQPFVVQPSYVLIAIDIDASMFITNGSKRSAFIDCLEACSRLYNSLVLASRGSVKGPVSIVLADNEAGKATFIDFEEPIPDSVKLLKDLKILSNDKLKDKYLRKGDFDLGDFFLFCKNKLSTITGDSYKKSVYYITNNDDPVSSDAKKRFKIINEAQKFAALHINLLIVTFKIDFDAENLYSEILTASNSPPVEIVKDAEGLTNEISNLVKRKFTKYRIKFYPFPGDTDSYLDLIINKFVKSATTTKNMYVTRDTQKEVKKVTKQPVYTAEYNCIFNPKQPPLIISSLEKANLTETNVPVGLMLLYVSNESFKQGWIIEPPSLIEKHHKETRVIFDAFWQYCKDNSKCLVCLRKYRRGGELRVLELVPRFINNKRMFLAKTYPFGSDVYYTPTAKPEVHFLEEEENAMGSLVDCLTFDYDPLNFSDPIESKRRAYIKSELLDEPLEKIEDGVPTDEIVNDQVHYFVNEFRRLELVESETTGKRSTAAPRGRRKKARVD